MGWQDRPYYRDRSSGSSNPLMWLVAGSVSLGTWFGIHVRVHASLIILIVWTLLAPSSLEGRTNAATFDLILFGSVLLHEFGHCFASRSVGGTPSEILMHPLGGLASADSPHRAWPRFVTVAGGPLVNVAICLVTAGGLMLMSGHLDAVPWNLMSVNLGELLQRSTLAYYLVWIFIVNYGLLLFNLLPVFPLDGGQMVQAILWGKFGYYKATLFATITGMIGAVLFAGWSLLHHSLTMAILAAWGFFYCFQMYHQLKANGPWAYQEDSTDYSAAYEQPARPKKSAARKLRKAREVERAAADEQERIDAILDKVHKKGMQSLTWLEKRALHKATERQRERGAPRR